jgi:hypothetical protein
MDASIQTLKLIPLLQTSPPYPARVGKTLGWCRRGNHEKDLSGLSSVRKRTSPYPLLFYTPPSHGVKKDIPTLKRQAFKPIFRSPIPEFEI